jgi:hypothetical protein
MLSLIPKHVRAALKTEFHLQVKTAYTKHLNEELAAVQATVPQAALPSLPLIVPNITPAKKAKPATETTENKQSKRKASGTPTHSPPNSKTPFGRVPANCDFFITRGFGSHAAEVRHSHELK